MHHYGSDGTLKATLSPVETKDPSWAVVSILWVENNTSVIVYSNPAEEHEYATYVMVHDTKANTATDYQVEDLVGPYGMTSRESSRSYVHLRSWKPLKHLIIVSDGPSDEISVVGGMEEGQAPWAKLDLDETARATIPLDEEGSSLTVVGLDLDLTSQKPINTSTQFDDDSPPIPPSPVLFVYTNDGSIVAYHLLNLETPAYPGMVAPDQLKQATPAPAPSDATPATSEAPVPLKPAFGFGASFGNALSFGQSSTTPSTTPAKPPGATFGSSTFGTTPAPAFGQSGFGSFGAKPAATAAPAFGQSGFGSTGSAFGSTGFGASTTPSSGGTSAAPAFGQSGFGALATKPGTTQTTTPTTGGGFGGFGAFASRAPSAFGSAGSTPNADSTTPVRPPAGFGFAAVAPPSKFSSVLPGTGAFGKNAPPVPVPAFGSSTTPVKPPSQAGQDDSNPSTTPSTTPAGKPVFGSIGFGATAISKAPEVLKPVTVSSGGGFGGFGSGSTSFAGFGAAASGSGSFADLLQTNSSGSTTPAKPVPSFKSGPTPTPIKPIAATGVFAARSSIIKDDDDRDDDQQDRNSDSDQDEPKQPVTKAKTSDSGATPPISAWSAMSLGTAVPESSTSTPSTARRSMFAPPTGASSSSFTPTALFSAITQSTAMPTTTSGSSELETPTDDEGTADGSNDGGDESGDEGGEDDRSARQEGSEDHAEASQDEEQEEELEEVDPEEASARPLTPVTEGEEEEEEDEEATGLGDSGYIVAERPSQDSSDAKSSTSTPSRHQRPPSPTATPKPVPAGSALGITNFSFGPSKTSGPSRSPFTPARSSPLSTPPVRGGSPDTPETSAGASGVAKHKTQNAKASGGALQMPQPKPAVAAPLSLPLKDDEEDQRPRTRSKTPPLSSFGFGFGSKASKPMPSPSTSSTPTTAKPLFGAAPFSFGNKATSTTETPPENTEPVTKPTQPQPTSKEPVRAPETQPPAAPAPPKPTGMETEFNKIITWTEEDIKRVSWGSALLPCACLTLA